MKSKLNSLGLALVAILALSVMQASTASAHKFKAGVTAGLTAEVAGATADEKDQVFEATTGEHKAVICAAINAIGTVGAVASDELTIEPTYAECDFWQTKAGGTTTKTADTEKVASAQVNTTSCHYRFFGTTTAGNPTGGEHANLELKSTEGCSHINITATGFKLKCISIPTQLIKHAVRYKNEVTGTGTEDLIVEATAHGIRTTTTDSVVCPTKTGETEEHDNGSYTGKFRLKGFKDLAHKEPTDVTVE